MHFLISIRKSNQFGWGALKRFRDEIAEPVGPNYIRACVTFFDVLWRTRRLSIA
jgi:hypothetical protein